MSSSIQPPKKHIPENAISERSPNFSKEKTQPLRPVSINLSLFPKLIWSKESKIPSLTFNSSLVPEPERPSKKPRRPDADDDNSLEAEIEGTKYEIRLLFAKLEACRQKGVVVKGQKPPIVGAAAAAAVCAKKPVKREDAISGNLKPRTLLHERQNPASGKRPVNSDIMEVVSSPCHPPGLDLKRKRCS